MTCLFSVDIAELSMGGFFGRETYIAAEVVVWPVVGWARIHFGSILCVSIFFGWACVRFVGGLD